MAELIDVLRRANARQATRSVGLDPNQPRSFSTNMKAMGKEADILALPADPNVPLALQVLDTTSADFGKFYATALYDVPGDTNHPVR